ncbi:hypothetical protein H2203_002725 [Taxawa tesnikishii (nom. ined.)]|nr:hypothetical protein H2203_002725 [Dothideales sp. JES 119]
MAASPTHLPLSPLPSRSSSHKLATNVFRSPNPSYSGYKVELLLPRALAGLALGFANINNLATLLDLFGASLQSTNPHQEFVARDDVRRQGGGMGLWLGVWAWCWIGSLSVGFAIVGFYVVVILLAFFLVINVVAPETRRASYRRSILHYFDEEEKVKRRVARGEVMLHISQDGPKWWWQEARAGVKLMWMMAKQPGFFVLALYLAWIYAQVVLVTLLLGALLSRDYRWHAQYVGLAVLAIALGALLAVPLAYAGLFSRTRKTGPRTDSMTFQTQLTWSSHFVRRCIFTLVLPFAGLAYTLASPGPRVSAAVPILFAAFVGFLSCLAVTECVGLIMETFDTSDLQPGINSRHRLQSLAESTRKRRTNYSSFPRVAAGLFFSQGLGFLLAAAATGVSGTITRALGAQAATGCVAGILLGITIFLTLVLLRWKSVQVIPKGALPRFGSADERMLEIYAEGDEYWKPVVIGTPSGEVRRMNLLELGNMSRWTEIRRLNKLIKE